ncbi:dCTP deaminase [Micromonospora chokoriensis]|uniref:dCTP deaminase n=1 Tax=Micromonospora chokoriensis TaxID=356851 RepID=UPI0018DD4CB2|nr:deoxycytidine triphosphate deaminase [Micromonospora chokoriensis]
MILTGNEIVRQRRLCNITLDPFMPAQVNPNSYNYRLGPVIKPFQGVDDVGLPVFSEVEIPSDGYVLQPGRMYLGNTMEVIGSSEYAMSLIGRSSIGRLGLFLQVSANLGHTTSCHQWTLELVCVKPFRVYPAMTIGQVSFWTNFGSVDPYKGHYGRQNEPTESVLLTRREERGPSRKIPTKTGSTDARSS